LELKLEFGRFIFEKFQQFSFSLKEKQSKRCSNCSFNYCSSYCFCPWRPFVL